MEPSDVETLPKLIITKKETPTRRRLGRIPIRTLSMLTPPKASSPQASPVKRAPATLTAAPEYPNANATELKMVEIETNGAGKPDSATKEEVKSTKVVAVQNEEIISTVLAQPPPPPQPPSTPALCGKQNDDESKASDTSIAITKKRPICETCNKEFSSTSTLNRHVYSKHHKIEMPVDDSDDF